MEARGRKGNGYDFIFNRKPADSRRKEEY